MHSGRLQINCRETVFIRIIFKFVLSCVASFHCSPPTSGTKFQLCWGGDTKDGFQVHSWIISSDVNHDWTRDLPSKLYKKPNKNNNYFPTESVFQILKQDVGESGGIRSVTEPMVDQKIFNCAAEMRMQHTAKRVNRKMRALGVPGEANRNQGTVPKIYKTKK